MAFIPPKFQPSPKGGMLFVNPPGVANFRALRVESGDQHLYWQPTYQHILRVEGAFGEFFPQAEFSDNGNQVIFTKYVDQAEVLCRTRALRPGERIPRGEWQRFLETWTNFKRLADRSDIPEDVRNFILKFGPPSVERYPAAYRIYRPHWYSKSRLFILWGLEPVGGADFISVSPEQAISEGTARAETDGEEASGDFLRWLKIFLFGLLALAALLFLFWCFLPRPIVDFEVTAEAEQPATTRNLTRIDQDWDWGVQAYRWTFAEGEPGTSTEFEPKPVWKLAGPHDVTLEATRSTLWGLLYKTDAKTLAISVAERPKPPVVSTPPLAPIQGLPPLTLPTGEVIPPGKMPLDEKMPPGAPKSDGPKPEGKPVPAPATPGYDGKMPLDEKMPLPRSRILPVPQVSIDGVEPLADGKAQDIEFSLNLPNGVRLERLELDGKQVTVPANGHFKLRLPTGPHVVHIEYGSTSSDLRGEVTQELLVDADQVKVIKPKTRIAPPVKVPGADTPVPTKPRDEAAEKFDKKTA